MHVQYRMHSVKKKTHLELLNATRKRMHIKILGTAFQKCLKKKCASYMQDLMHAQVCKALWTHLLNLSI